MERVFSLKRAAELIEQEEGAKISKGKVISYEKRLNAALMLYELTAKDKEIDIDFQEEVEEVYLKLYKLYRDKNRLIMNLGKEKKDTLYLKSDDFEEDLLKLAIEFEVEEEYREFIKVEEYLKEQRDIYIENGVTEYYPMVNLAMDLIAKTPLIKEQSKAREIKKVIDEETGVAIGKKIKELLKIDYKTVFVNKGTPKEDHLLLPKRLKPKKAVLYSLRLNRYDILKDEEIDFRNSFFDRLGGDEGDLDVIIKKVEKLEELKGKKVLSILKELLDESSISEHNIMAKYEEVRVVFNETYEKFKENFPWILKLYTDEEALKLVYIYFLIYKKEFYYSPSKKVQYKHLLKKLVNKKVVTAREKSFILQDFFLMVLLYLDQDLESVMRYIMNISHEFLLSYLNLVLEGIEKWDLYEKQFGERKLEKLNKDENLLMLIVMKSRMKEDFELDKYLF